MLPLYCVLQPNPRANDPPSKSAPNGKKSAAAVAAAAAAGPPPAAAPPAAVVSNVSASFRAGAYENGLITACNNVSRCTIKT